MGIKLTACDACGAAMKLKAPAAAPVAEKPKSLWCIRKYGVEPRISATAPRFTYPKCQDTFTAPR